MTLDLRVQCPRVVMDVKLKLYMRSVRTSASPEVIKTIFMLNSTEHEISTAHKKTKIPTNEDVSGFKSL